jgi:phage terminase large subunit GpA-like protein
MDGRQVWVKTDVLRRNIDISCPVDLLEKRSTTFEGVRKIWRTSSPSIETGPIWRFMTEQAHVVYAYWVKCPRCGGWQFMSFDWLWI